MQAGNLTNAFAALLIILKSTFTLVVPMKHCSDEFRFAHQQNLYRTISLLLISLKGESYMYLGCVSLNLSRKWIIPNLLFSVNKAR